MTNDELTHLRYKWASVALFKQIDQLDFEVNNDYFGWKSGGDGDNGEVLMYLLDMIFEAEDLAASVTQRVGVKDE